MNSEYSLFISIYIRSQVVKLCFSSCSSVLVICGFLLERDFLENTANELQIGAWLESVAVGKLVVLKQQVTLLMRNDLTKRDSKAQYLTLFGAFLGHYS